MSDKDRLQKELELLFGEETVRVAIAQEFLALKYSLNHPIEIRNALYSFQNTSDLEQQKVFAEGLDRELARAFICALLCDTATKALQEIALEAVRDKRAGRVVLPNRRERATEPLSLTQLKKRRGRTS